MISMNPELGRCTIGETGAVGTDPREGEAFAMLQAEIDRLTDIHAPGEPDWKRVAELAEGILRDEGKDLAVASWLLMAWVKLNGLSGLVAGVAVLRDLHQAFWDGMYPMRQRGRRNQMAWLVDWITGTLDALPEELPALAPEAHAQLLSAWTELDAIWRERDEDGPSLATVTARLQRLPVEQPLEQAQAPVDTTQVPAAQGRPTDAASAPQSSASLSSASLVPAAPSAEDLAAVQNPQGLEHLLERLLASVQPLLDEAIARFPELAWSYRLNRAHAWSIIDAAPVATDGVTRLPGPTPAERDMLDRLADAADGRDLLRFTESCLSRHRFWLDLNYHSWRVLSAMPAGRDAAHAVAAETAAFVNRLGALASLSFSDGTPFASAQTRQWLASQAPVSADADDAFEYRGTPADTLALATAIAAASAQTESAHSMLASALERLRETAQQVARQVTVA